MNKVFSLFSNELQRLKINKQSGFSLTCFEVGDDILFILSSWKEQLNHS